MLCVLQEGLTTQALIKVIQSQKVKEGINDLHDPEAPPLPNRTVTNQSPIKVNGLQNSEAPPLSNSPTTNQSQASHPTEDLTVYPNSNYNRRNTETTRLNSDEGSTAYPYSPYDKSRGQTRPPDDAPNEQNSGSTEMVEYPKVNKSDGNESKPRDNLAFVDETSNADFEEPPLDYDDDDSD